MPGIQRFLFIDIVCCPDTIGHMNATALKDLGQFTGTENYFNFPPFPAFVITDGVKFLCENADCFWLLNDIAANQIRPEIKNDERLQQMQFWSLKSRGDGKATLICERDSDDVAFTTEIPYTDFPFDVVPNPRVWVAPTGDEKGKLVRVAYLPSEH